MRWRFFDIAWNRSLRQRQKFGVAWNSFWMVACLQTHRRDTYSVFNFWTARLSTAEVWILCSEISLQLRAHVAILYSARLRAAVETFSVISEESSVKQFFHCATHWGRRASWDRRIFSPTVWMPRKKWMEKPWIGISWFPFFWARHSWHWYWPKIGSSLQHRWSLSCRRCRRLLGVASTFFENLHYLRCKAPAVMSLIGYLCTIAYYDGKTREGLW